MQLNWLILLSFIIAFGDAAMAQHRIGFNVSGGIGRLSHPPGFDFNDEYYESPGPSIQLAGFYKRDLNKTYFIGTALGMNYLSVFQRSRIYSNQAISVQHSDWHIFASSLSIHGGIRLASIECALGLRASGPINNIINTYGYSIKNGNRKEYSVTFSEDLINFDLGPELQLGYRLSDKMLLNLVLYHGFRPNEIRDFFYPIRYFQQFVIGVQYTEWQ